MLEIYDSCSLDPVRKNFWNDFKCQTSFYGLEQHTARQENFKHAVKRAPQISRFWWMGGCCETKITFLCFQIIFRVAHKDKTLPRTEKHFWELKTLNRTEMPFRIENTYQNWKHFPALNSPPEGLVTESSDKSVFNSGTCF